MTIYLDIIFLENIFMNFIILFATAVINKVKIKEIRILISSLIGSIYAILSFMPIHEMYKNVILKIILSVAMVYIAFSPGNIRKLIKQLMIFYLVSFTFGGITFALLYFIRPQDILMRNGIYIGTYPLKMALLSSVVGFIIITTAFKTIKGKLNRKDMICNIEIILEGKSKKVKALLDTGNLLREPLTGMPVIIVEAEDLGELLPKQILENIGNIVNGKINSNSEINKYISKFRIIPYSSLGKQNGLLLGFRVDKVIIKNDEKEIKSKEMMIGIYER